MKTFIVVLASCLAAQGQAAPSDYAAGERDFALPRAEAEIREKIGILKERMPESSQDCRECLDVPGVVPAPTKGVFFEENPDFKMDWDRLAEIEKFVRIPHYPDGSPEVISIDGHHEVKVGKRTFGIGLPGQRSIEKIRLYPNGAVKALFLSRPMTAIAVGGNEYIFLSRLCRDTGRHYSSQDHEYRESMNCGRLGIGFHENGEIQVGIVVVMRQGCPIEVAKVTFDTEGHLIEEVGSEKVPELGKPSLSPDFYKEYEEAMRQNREKR